MFEEQIRSFAQADILCEVASKCSVRLAMVRKVHGSHVIGKFSRVSTNKMILHWLYFSLFILYTLLLLATLILQISVSLQSPLPEVSNSSFQSDGYPTFGIATHSLWIQSGAWHRQKASLDIHKHLAFSPDSTSFRFPDHNFSSLQLPSYPFIPNQLFPATSGYFLKIIHLHSKICPSMALQSQVPHLRFFPFH